MTFRAWLVWGVLVATMLAGVVWMLRPTPKGLPGADAARQHAQEAVEAVARKDEAIRNLSRQISTLTTEANAARQRADAASARERLLAVRADDLGAKVAQLEAAAKARPPIDSRARALQVLHEMGYR